MPKCGCCGYESKDKDEFLKDGSETLCLKYCLFTDEKPTMTLVDLKTGKTLRPILEARQELHEIESYVGVNLLDTRYGFSRNKRLQQLCKLTFG